MKTTILKSFLFLALSAGFISSCVNDDDYQTPEYVCNEPNLVVTKTMQEIFDMATASPVLYTENDVIEAVVVSSDKGGNFFKTMHLQSPDNTIALTVLVDFANAATLFQPGRKVYVQLKDRYIQIKDGGLLIGQIDNGSIWRIPYTQTFTTVQRSCAGLVPEDQLVQSLTIEQALASNEHLNKLIQFDNVQFASSAVGQPYHVVDNGTSGTNHTLIDQNGTSIIVRSTSFSKYATEIVPAESGSIRGVLTRFGNTFQFTPRYFSDIKLDQPRFYINTQLGGTNIMYTGMLSENFESYATNNRIFPNYINDAYVGGRYWEVKSFSNNKYIQMSSFGSNEANRTLFFVPADFSAANTFSFKTKDGYNNGDVLKVYYTTNYTPATDISSATLVDITNQFTIATGATNNYATNFTNSGVYNIPGTVTGNGFFIFEYSGSGTAPLLTTTMQIDDIVIN